MVRFVSYRRDEHTTDIVDLKYNSVAITVHANPLVDTVLNLLNEWEKLNGA